MFWKDDNDLHVLSQAFHASLDTTLLHLYRKYGHKKDSGQDMEYVFTNPVLLFHTKGILLWLHYRQAKAEAVCLRSL